MTSEIMFYNFKGHSVNVKFYFVFKICFISTLLVYIFMKMLRMMISNIFDL